ncbi:uncharacterized protein B0T23DRAFT_223441 [Neurospora hispaniola]|uniref:Uncharacterized protein n=1 Tax=Neurospora hispaniola TaxID=588809 RepID=A0AAJ0MNZ9_9PEZI|nr:hypothetical protein B0T23DRAFT_223441 [Neurospora hispaniola]
MMGRDGTLLCTLGTAMQKIDHAALHSEQQAHLHLSFIPLHARPPADPPNGPDHRRSFIRFGWHGWERGCWVESSSSFGRGSAVPVPAAVVPLFLFFQFGLGNTVEVFFFPSSLADDLVSIMTNYMIDCRSYQVALRLSMSNGHEATYEARGGPSLVGDEGSSTILVLGQTTFGHPRRNEAGRLAENHHIICTRDVPWKALLLVLIRCSISSALAPANGLLTSSFSSPVLVRSVHLWSLQCTLTQIGH